MPRCNEVVGRLLLRPPYRRGALLDFTGRFIRHRYPKATSPKVPNVPRLEVELVIINQSFRNINYIPHAREA